MERGWVFDESKNVAVFTTKQIIFEGEPILYVVHDEEDGAWQFLHDSIVSLDDAAVAGLSEIVEMDESINELYNLPLGWEAFRIKKAAQWEWQKTL